MNVNSISSSAFQTAESLRSSAATGTGFSALLGAVKSPEVSDTVSISSQSRAKAADAANEADATGITSTSTSTSSSGSSAPPELKSMAMPSWMASYYPSVGKVGMTGLELQAMNARFDSLSGPEQSQYYAAIQKHYQDTLENNNLVDNPNKYDLLIANKESSEKLRQEFEKRIASDTALTALLARMSKLAA